MKSYILPLEKQNGGSGVRIKEFQLETQELGQLEQS